MAFLETVGFLGGALFVVIVVAAVFMASWSHASGGPVLLYEMLRRQGDDVARFATASGSRDFALAVNQCVRCASTARCRAFLDSRRRDGFDAFCGNASYVANMRGIATLTRAPRWA
jgi:hypothetical protein